MNSPFLDHKTILLPVCAQVMLTLAVWLWMYYLRLGAIFKNKVHPQALADPERAQVIFKDATNPSDNLENLFEIPVLFFAAAIIIYVTHKVDTLYLVLAWTFVGFRVLHSFIHCTSNVIRLRFAMYLFSCVAVWWMWVRILIYSL